MLYDGPYHTPGAMQYGKPFELLFISRIKIADIKNVIVFSQVKCHHRLPFKIYIYFLISIITLLLVKIIIFDI